MPVALYRRLVPPVKRGSQAASRQRNLAHDVPAWISRPICACFNARCAAASSAVTRCSTSCAPSTPRSSREDRRLDRRSRRDLGAAPCWAVVSADLSGQSSVLADRGLTPDMGPAVYGIAGWVMHRGQDSSPPICAPTRASRDRPVGAVIAFPLSCRGRRVGALIALDRAAVGARAADGGEHAAGGARAARAGRRSRSTMRCCSSAPRRSRSPTISRISTTRAT